MNKYFIFASSLDDSTKGWQSFRRAVSDKSVAFNWLKEYRQLGFRWCQIVDTQEMRVIHSFGC